MTPHLSHWGAFEAATDGHRLTAVRPWREDPEPTPLLDNIASAQHHPARVDRPHVRVGWLEDGPGTPGRGEDRYVPVAWDEVLDRLANELARVYGDHGAGAVYGGSYGWSSAGRFHHAQSQVHRFLNCLGGYVRSVNSYSLGASQVLLPHVIGSWSQIRDGSTAKTVVSRNTELVVAFGGISPKNSAISPGGVARHDTRSWIAQARSRGCRFVSVSPLRDDSPAEAQAEWIAPRPGSDAALMLALAHVLDGEGSADRAFLEQYTVGYDRFIAYVRGDVDGVAKSPEWAEQLTGVAAGRLRDLARDMASARTFITVSWSLQRAEFGEQPLWLGIVLAAMLGQIGLPGGGFGHGYGSTASVGTAARLHVPHVPQGRNPVPEFIPVARVADMLLNPGADFDYNGQRLRYPDIRLVYWSGGNPFHHHQDLARLRQAFSRPETVVVNDPFWSATARHADVVLPSTMTIERDDLGCGENDRVFMPMKALTVPHAEARDDYDIFAALSERLGTAESFTEGRTSAEWLRHLYEEWRRELLADGHDVPDFQTFWESDYIEVPVPDPEQILLADFRTDPQVHRLTTPSGRIEVFSEVIDGFGYDDCPGHPRWLEPSEWLGSPAAAQFPLQLIANQPRTRLHSQLDVGAHSQASKVSGREPVRMNPRDASDRGLGDGDVVRLFNDRGSALAGLVVDDGVREGVVQLSTGAWYDPDPGDPTFCRHGNPNVLTADRPTSRLSQACTGQLALVQVEAFAGPVPELTVDRPPTMG
ncbi:molybdopterin-dependent oxidoreductase [Georgenia alba]|uniref:Molybdopterin-dependent oxidoreductase n=1 Tax=Georgenia alba TaxID=2233858 RepID=A0ABW2Q8B5_9MICO